MTNLAPATHCVATDRARAMAPLDGLTAEQWQSLSEAERREISLIEHRGGTAFDLEQQRIDADADPATMAALDALIADETASDVAPSLSNPLTEKPRHRSCSVPLVRRAGGALETVWMPCHRRKCLNCTDIWQNTKLTDLYAVIDRLSGSDIDASIALSVDAVREDDWIATSTRLRRHGAGWFTVPLADSWRLVLTDDPDFGVPRPAYDAAAAAAAALADLALRADETRHVRFSKSWKDLADAHKPAEVEADQDEGIEWLGVATKAKTPDKVVHAAQRAGGVAGPVASRDADPDGARCWRAKVSAEKEWLFLELIGFKTFAEIATERAERKAAQDFERWERDQRRRPIHNTSIGRPREMAAA